MKDQKALAQKIRAQYTGQPHTRMDELKALDARVRKPAMVFGYTCGSIGAIVMGAGMSLVMTDIGTKIGLAATLIPGIAIGVVGMVMALSAYLIYKRILNARKRKYAPKIMELTEELMQE